ncbi:MAG: helix-turn-helix domain-containing protein [Thermodesulfobacteriota bacterium]
MKRIEKQTYYEILEIPPDASVKEVQRAYEHAKETFDRESLAIYSLFSEKELQEIQGAVEEAYRVLMDENLRKNYDQFHLRPSIEKNRGKPFEKPTIQEKETSLSFTGLSTPIEAECYRGKILKEIREKMGIDLKAISSETKINPKILEWIEEEAWDKLPPQVYLKGFLKGYAQLLNLDPKKVLEDYFKFSPESKKK